MHGNLIANAGRGRNKDEGYVNAWDRLPYITTLGMRLASVVEMYSIPIGFQYLLKVTCVSKSENGYFH